MGYLMPKPPGLSKKQSDEWDKREDRYYKVMAILMAIATGLFILLAVIMAIASKIKA